MGGTTAKMESLFDLRDFAPAKIRENTFATLILPRYSFSVTQRQRFLAVSLILIHLIISLVHGAAHQAATVRLSMFGNVYVLVVITIAPLVAAGFLFTRRQKAATLLLGLSMLGAFLFGFWFHFLSATNDNVAQVHGAWHATFLWTAIALAAIEFSGALLAFWWYRVNSYKGAVR